MKKTIEIFNEKYKENYTNGTIQNGVYENSGMKAANENHWTYGSFK